MGKNSKPAKASKKDSDRIASSAPAEISLEKTKKAPAKSAFLPVDKKDSK
jgi:hypothetical protein